MQLGLLLSIPPVNTKYLIQNTKYCAKRLVSVSYRKTPKQYIKIHLLNFPVII